ncbi:MAG: MBL fold metallo-hydrolase [Gemmatimonadaceae bacterium]|nr:MBL fold metallo-hydrolase [Gemmatimonadaceae bacterium]
MSSTDRPPHHDPRGGFRNPWANSEAGTPASVLKWVATRWRDRRPDPKPSAFARVPPAFATPRAAPDELRVTWIGHSTVLVQLGAITILTDPVWARRVGPLGVFGPARWVPPGAALDALPPIDLVLLSHNHYDHFDRAAIRRLARRDTTAWATPLGVAASVRALGVAAPIELDWWQSAEHRTRDGQSLTIAAVPAQHFSGRGVADRNQSLWCGFVVRTPAHTLYFAGDSGLHPEFGRIAEAHGPFDVVCMPIGAYEPRWFMRPVHMSADEAIDAYRAIRAVHPHAARPSRFVPMHWGTFKLTDEPMDEPPRRARAAWDAAGFAADDFWLLRHGETRIAPLPPPTPP